MRDFREEEVSEDWERVARITVRPGEAFTGEFTAGPSFLGLSSDDDRSFHEVAIRWIATVFRASYTFRVWDDLPTATIVST